MDVSPSLHMPYYRAAALEESYYLTQGETGQAAKVALATGNFKYFQLPDRFILGKSLVGGTVTGDIFEGAVRGPIPFAPVCGYRPQVARGSPSNWGTLGPFTGNSGLLTALDTLRFDESAGDRSRPGWHIGAAFFAP